MAPQADTPRGWSSAPASPHLSTRSPRRDGASPTEPVLPMFPGGALPPPESAARKAFIRAVALLALTASALYLTWRAVASVNLAHWWVAVPLYVLEVHSALGLALFTFSLWEVDTVPPPPPVDQTTAKLAILIPTYNEGVEILLPTIAAAVAVRLPHETWVLDDGRRPWVEELATALGARYLSRPRNTHAKAGNLNHALQVIDADFIAVLDADHVPLPNLFRNTLGYFDDPRVALVQTPQDFFNLDSFEHEDADVTAALDGALDDEERIRFSEQALFYRVIAPGKNRWDAAFWCGTGAVLRVAALRDVGGVATETITEDIHTTVRLHRRGWRTVYHNEVLARGVAAATAEQYQLQRFRWGTGAMQLIRVENPLVVRGLTLSQRIAYLATLAAWFDGWRTLFYLLLPPAVLLTGAVPIRGNPLIFAGGFLTAFALQAASMYLLARGHAPPRLALMFDVIRMTPSLLATLSLVRRRPVKFRVTPKGRVSDSRLRVQAPTLLYVLLGLSGVAAVWFIATVAGWTPLRYAEPWAAYTSAVWLGLNSALLLSAVRRIRSPRFAAERRASVRFKTRLEGTVDGMPCAVEDLSVTGARVVLAGHPLTHPVCRLSLAIDNLTLTLDAAVRSTRTLPTGETVHGLEFLPDQYCERAALALALLNRDLTAAAQWSAPDSNDPVPGSRAA
jgi:cellulose synthase (UDP-forming)